MLHNVPTFQGDAACAEPQHLDTVDKAFKRSGGPEAHWMKDNLCKPCEITEQCFTWAMTHGEFGVWGGTGQKARTHAGAPSPRTNSSEY